MTETQFERWMDFAARMANHGWPNATDARKEKVEAAVVDFIDRWKDDCEAIHDWDGNWPNERGIYLCDEIDDFFYYADLRHHTWPDGTPKQTRFQMQVTCCVRAGFDQAVKPSAGVLGFDVGLLRRMWEGEEIPAWVVEGFEPPITAETPDSEGVWL